MRLPEVLTTSLILTAAAILIAIFVDRRADFKEAGIEATYPPLGEIIQVDGRDVHIHIRGEGPDLVLIHGAGANLREMTASIADDLATRYRVIMVDRPGHGWTDASPETKGPFRNSGESPISQARLLSQAVSQVGAENPIVLGHSFGGAVAMAWGLEATPSALVIISGVTLPWPGSVDPYYRVLGSKLGGAILAPLGSAFVTDNYVRGIIDNTFAPQSPPSEYYAKAGIPLAVRTRTLRANNRQVKTLKPYVIAQSERYDSITVPIEIIHGTADKTVFAEIHATPLAERMDNVNVLLLDGMGHMPHHLAPEEIIAAVDRAAERAGLR